MLPSHGRPFRGLHHRIGQLKSHHQARLEALAQACSEPRAAAELLPGLFGRDFNDYQLLFAMGETIAHLNHLWRGGVMRRVAGQDGVWRYVRVS